MKALKTCLPPCTALPKTLRSGTRSYGTELQTVVLGGKETPTLRKMVADIDERHSRIAEQVVEQASARFTVLAERMQAKVDRRPAGSGEKRHRHGHHPRARCRGQRRLRSGHGRITLGCPGTPEAQARPDRLGALSSATWMRGNRDAQSYNTSTPGSLPPRKEESDMSQASVPVANGYKAFGGTTAQWAASDDRLKYREMGVEYTPDGLVLIKFGIKTEGDVGTPWSELPYSSGLAGPSPAVEWDGPRLRVKNADGTWTGWVNLQGPSVDYMWTGTSLMTQNRTAPGEIPWICRAGGPGSTSVPSTPSSLGGVMPRAGLSVDPDGYLDQDLTWSNRQCYRTPILVLHSSAALKWLAV